MKTQRPGSGARILGIGAYRPRRIVGNDELEAPTGRSDDWIRRRTGIVERRFAEPGETVMDMAVEAARKALADAGVTPDRVDLVLLSSMSNLRQSPGGAPEVAHRLGTGSAALDLNAACAGFCYALGVADGLVRSGTAGHVLVIGSDKMSDLVDPYDTSAAFLFADGAGAMVVGPTADEGIGPVIWGADGGLRHLIAHSATWRELRDAPDMPWPTMKMRGTEVFRWAVGEIPAIAEQALRAAGATAADLCAFVPHQANLRITNAMAGRLALPPHVAVARDITHTGNTSAASIPLAIDRLRETGAVPPGGLALLAGFGAGLSWAAQVVRLP
ncbi:beta-ketoacyl-ACP synthase III [Streptomyces sp. NRRL B-3229]|uniref:beta-ketoacyl-ACP synthase III n=1 Tax=Streptomyces sp. NRRL B-3229 TaxID=1463836 RepID=UPI0004BE5A2A|nr:beta-ketoacyl-ACP synthase III [Streptomyces sp. NRRL B-3229]